MTSHTLKAADTEDPERILGVVNPGMYFRTRHAITPSQPLGDIKAASTEIPADTVLMVSEVRLVDDVPHTIIFRPHPDWVVNYKRAVQEIRFLVQDFVEAFEEAPDGEDVRKRELWMTQQRIQKIQDEMRILRENPAELQRRYLLSLQEAGKTMPAVIQPSRIPSSMTDVLNSSLEDFQNKVEAGREMVQFAADQMQEVSSKLNEAVAATVPYYQETAAVAIARVSDSIDHANKVVDGVRTMDLWLGKDVELLTLRKGQPAKDSEPITYYQRLLMLAPEMAVDRHVRDEFSARDFPEIINELQINAALVNRMLPAERSVVSVAIRRDAVDYGDAFSNDKINQANRETFLLVRDGENLHVVFSPLWQHKALSRLFPSQSEMDTIYRSRDGDEITFSDLSYTDAKTKHERMATQYRRLLVLLGGLHFRKRIFNGRCPQEDAVFFTRREFSDRFMHFVYDEEGHNLIADGLTQKFTPWQYAERANLLTDSGSSVLMDCYGFIDPKSAPSACKRYGNNDSFFRNSSPAHAFHTGKVISTQDRTGFKFKVPHDNGKNVSVFLDEALKGRAYWTSKLGWLNLDGCLQEEIRSLMTNRDNQDRSWTSWMNLYRIAISELDVRDETESVERQSWLAESGLAKKEFRQLYRSWRLHYPSAALPGYQEASRKRHPLFLMSASYLTTKNNANAISSEFEEMQENLIRIDIDINADPVYWTTKAPCDRDERIYDDVEVWKRDSEGRQSVVYEDVGPDMVCVFQERKLHQDMLNQAKLSPAASGEREALETALNLDWSAAHQRIRSPNYWDTVYSFSGMTRGQWSDGYFGIPVGYIYSPEYQDHGHTEKGPLLGVVYQYRSWRDEIRIACMPIENCRRVIYDQDGKPAGLAIRNRHLRAFLSSMTMSPSTPIEDVLASNEFRNMVKDFEFGRTFPQTNMSTAPRP